MRTWEQARERAVSPTRFCALTLASCSMRVRTMSMKPRADACPQESVGVNLVSIWQPSNCSLSQNHVRPKRKRTDAIRSGQSCPGFQHAYRIKGKNEGKSRANLEDECGSSAYLHEGGAGPVVLRVGVGGHERRAVSLHRACGQPDPGLWSANDFIKAAILRERTTAMIDL